MTFIYIKPTFQEPPHIHRALNGYKATCTIMLSNWAHQEQLPQITVLLPDYLSAWPTHATPPSGDSLSIVLPSWLILPKHLHRKSVIPKCSTNIPTISPQSWRRNARLLGVPRVCTARQHMCAFLPARRVSSSHSSDAHDVMIGSFHHRKLWRR
ncbi:hypothetical protein M413DRAFT_372128 [Hebeloma cylindrosporum]|uniref:Uncharacterized protein n=1 Tax=Hebeloma cylindrosporum TaxID=76867 RepID=A0A0C3C519_HEBCY|nr:hypothetical protein M413DRAFT_372128 [Hebeloma cylindrosporum h7]